MAVRLLIRNESERKRLYRRDVLRRLAERICEGEGVTQPVEISVLFCDDDRMAELNAAYRDTPEPTDVLSFEQPQVPGGSLAALGDIVVSLEMAERYSAGDRAKTREEVRLLFCHGLLHLLGYDHQTRRERERMTMKQAQYLGVDQDAAWWSDSRPNASEPRVETN